MMGVSNSLKLALEGKFTGQVRHKAEVDRQLVRDGFFAERVAGQVTTNVTYLIIKHPDGINTFLNFISAIRYVGEGDVMRPHAHLGRSGHTGDYIRYGWANEGVKFKIITIGKGTKDEMEQHESAIISSILNSAPINADGIHYGSRLWNRRQGAPKGRKFLATQELNFDLRAIEQNGRLEAVGTLHLLDAYDMFMANKAKVNFEYAELVE